MGDIGTNDTRHPNQKRPYYRGPKANTLPRAAALLGVDVATLKAAKDRGAEGFDGYGRVHIEVLRTWMANNPPPPAEKNEVESELSLKLRKLRVECQAKEHSLEVKKGNYLPISEVRERVTRAYSGVRTTMLQMRMLAPQLAGLPTHEISKRLDEAIREALQQAADLRF